MMTLKLLVPAAIHPRIQATNSRHPAATWQRQETIINILLKQLNYKIL